MENKDCKEFYTQIGFIDPVAFLIYLGLCKNSMDLN